MTPAMNPNNALNALNLLNPLAPPVYGGLVGPDGSVDFTYPYDVELTASDALSDVIKTNTDADFHLTGIIINAYTSIQFSFRLNVNGVYYLSSGLILAANLAGDPSAPVPVLGRFIIPRGADLNIDLQELSGSNNTIEIMFRGLKLYGGGSRQQATAAPKPVFGLGRWGGR
jgi:hypothetical protein